MRKLALCGTLLGATLLAGTAARAENYGMAGCGLGSLAFHENTTGMQILAATTNNIIVPQTFAHHVRDVELCRRRRHQGPARTGRVRRGELSGPEAEHGDGRR